MLSRVDMRSFELQNKSKIDILWIHDVMHIIIHSAYIL